MILRSRTHRAAGLVVPPLVAFTILWACGRSADTAPGAVPAMLDDSAADAVPLSSAISPARADSSVW
ncbi:MAG: hypothetical protein ABR527_10695, partial [Gemmatimonadota bacterium]